MSPSPRSRSGWSRISLFAPLLVVAIIVNVAQYGTVNEAASRNYTALQRYTTADLAEIGYLSRGTRERYGLYFALAELAPGARVLVATRNGKVKRELGGRLYSFGRVAELEPVSRELAERILADMQAFDPTSYVVASNTRGGRGNPWLIAGEPSGGSHQEPTEDLDDPLTTPWEPGAARQWQSAPAGPREFLLLPWELPDNEPGAAALDLLVETSLLPEAVRKDLPH